mgnify:FL=1
MDKHPHSYIDRIVETKRSLSLMKRKLDTVGVKRNRIRVNINLQTPSSSKEEITPPRNRSDIKRSVTPLNLIFPKDYKHRSQLITNCNRLKMTNNQSKLRPSSRLSSQESYESSPTPAKSSSVKRNSIKSEFRLVAPPIRQLKPKQVSPPFELSSKFAINRSKRASYFFKKFISL